MEIHKKYTYQRYVYQISSIKALPPYQHPYIQERRKLDFIIYTKNFLHEMESQYCIMGSINGDKQ